MPKGLKARDIAIAIAIAIENPEHTSLHEIRTVVVRRPRLTEERKSDEHGSRTGPDSAEGPRNRYRYRYRHRKSVAYIAAPKMSP